MAKRDLRIVTRADHDAIQKKLNLAKGEDYAVTVQKGKGFWVKTVHVFTRRPMLTEINEYEQRAGKVKFRGQNAQLEGSQIIAAVKLYDHLISRAFDVLVGMRVEDTLDRRGAITQVDPLLKREAIRELVGEVYSSTRMEESLGGGADEEAEGEGESKTASPDDEDSDDPEDHTSDESKDSEP